MNRQAVGVGVLVGVGNMFIYQHFMPPVTDVRRADQFEQDCEKSERQALLISVVFTAAVASFVRSWDTFLTAGVVIVGLDFAYKHAIAVHPETGTMQSPNQSAGAGGQQDDGNYSGADLHAMPDYAS